MNVHQMQAESVAELLLSPAAHGQRLAVCDDDAVAINFADI